MSIEQTATPTPISTPIPSSNAYDENSIRVESVDEDEGESENPNLSGSKQKYKSAVWLDFERIVNLDKSVVAIYNYCKHKFNGSSASGTSHLKSQLKRCKPVTKEQQILQVSKGAVGIGGSTLKNFKFDQNTSHLELAKMVIKHEFPFSVVEYEYFQQFVHSLQSMFKFVTRNTVKFDMMKVFNEENEKLFKYFYTLSYRVSLTTDMWTTESQNMGYCCLTCRYVDDQWELNKKIIGFKAVEGSHDAFSLSQVVMDLLI